MMSGDVNTLLFHGLVAGAQPRRQPRLFPIAW